MRFREITKEDIPALFEVRTATDENRLTIEQLTRMGITPETVREKIAGTFRGWLCEIEGRVVGFAMGNRATGEVWVIAVLPACIRMGIGTELMNRVEEWLFAEGCEAIWLTTDVDPALRAYGFYLKRGWVDDGIRDGDRYMKKLRRVSSV